VKFDGGKLLIVEYQKRSLSLRKGFHLKDFLVFGAGCTLELVAVEQDATGNIGFDLMNGITSRFFSQMMIIVCPSLLCRLRLEILSTYLT
jgi:hypothetical protein